MSFRFTMEPGALISMSLELYLDMLKSCESSFSLNNRASPKAPDTIPPSPKRDTSAHSIQSPHIFSKPNSLSSLG